MVLSSLQYFWGRTGYKIIFMLNMNVCTFCTNRKLCSRKVTCLGQRIFYLKLKHTCDKYNNMLVKLVDYTSMVGCFGFSGSLRQYFSLYQAVSQREGERGEKGQGE